MASRTGASVSCGASRGACRSRLNTGRLHRNVRCRDPTRRRESACALEKSCRLRRKRAHAPRSRRAGARGVCIRRTDERDAPGPCHCRDGGEAVNSGLAIARARSKDGCHTCAPETWRQPGESPGRIDPVGHWRCVAETSRCVSAWRAARPVAEHVALAPLARDGHKRRGAPSGDRARTTVQASVDRLALPSREAARRSPCTCDALFWQTTANCRCVRRLHAAASDAGRWVVGRHPYTAACLCRERRRAKRAIAAEAVNTRAVAPGPRR